MNGRFVKPVLNYSLNCVCVCVCCVWEMKEINGENDTSIEHTSRVSKQKKGDGFTTERAADLGLSPDSISFVATAKLALAREQQQQRHICHLPWRHEPQMTHHVRYPMQQGSIMSAPILGRGGGGGGKWWSMFVVFLGTLSA